MKMKQTILLIGAILCSVLIPIRRQHPAFDRTLREFYVFRTLPTSSGFRFRFGGDEDFADCNPTEESWLEVSSLDNPTLLSTPGSSSSQISTLEEREKSGFSLMGWLFCGVFPKKYQLPQIPMGKYYVAMQYDGVLRPYCGDFIEEIRREEIELKNPRLKKVKK